MTDILEIAMWVGVGALVHLLVALPLAFFVGKWIAHNSRPDASEAIDFEAEPVIDMALLEAELAMLRRVA